MELSPEEKELLLGLVRQAIDAKFAGKALPPAPAGAWEALRAHRGVFVSLKKGDRLRGCVGYIEGRKPLWQAVGELAQAAAFRDHRFKPLEPAELPPLQVEISILGSLKKITDINEIEVGRHGLYLKRGIMAGLLLPQVALEHKWDRLRFVEETCRKAGLPADSWKDEETEKYCFEALIFSGGMTKNT
jgi:AmmeMemoRadiSam system protein A